MRWLPAGCHQRMLPAETKDGRPREAGKPPGQNSPTRGSCPNTGSQSAPRQGEIKGAAQKGKVIFTLSARPQTIEGGPPQTQTLGQASETQRRRDGGSLSPSGGEEEQGARSGSFIKKLPPPWGGTSPRWSPSARAAVASESGGSHPRGGGATPSGAARGR